MWRLASSHRARVLLLAAALFAGVFVLRMLVDAAGTGVGFLYVLPIVMIAVELGRRAGLAAGVGAVALFAVWALTHAPDPVDALGYLSRATVFLLVGWVTGQMADRLRKVNERVEAGARYFELSRDLLCTASFAGYMTRLNGSWERTLGWTPEELMAVPFLDFVHPDDREHTEREAAALGTTGHFTVSFMNRYRTKDGGYRWIEWSSMADPEAQLIYAAARDVTERREAEQAQREAEERFRRSFEDSAVGMALVGIEGEKRNLILQANESLAEIIGMSVDELVGTPTLRDLADPDDLERVAEGMRELDEGEKALFRCEFRILRPDGRRVWVDLTTSLVQEDGRPLYRLSQIVDIDSRKRAAEQLQYLADHDALSGVFNRRRFEQELERELGHAAARGGRGAVLLIDVDDFKRINDTVGHATGDAVISRLGEMLSNRLRTSDVVARLGGDEFAVLLRRVDPEDAMRVACDLRSLAVERLSEFERGGVGPVTLSVGVATFGDHDQIPSPDDLLSQADHAMYDAKRAGGNRASSRIAA